MKKDPSQLLAIRYAHAFINLFIEHLSRADITAIEHAGTALTNNPRLLFFFKISVIPDATKRELVGKWLRDQRVPTVVDDLLELLIAHKRLSLLGIIFLDIASLYKDQKGIMEVTVTTSHAVTGAQQQALQHFCAATLPEKKLEYSYVYDPRLLVGMSMQTKTVRYERSLRKLLQEICPN